MRWPLGVVAVVYGGRPIGEVARLAAADGFEHLDAQHDTPDGLALPIADRWAPTPRPGCSTGPIPAWGWDECVSRYRRAPGSLLEPWGGGAVGSTEAVRAFAAEVPGQRFLIDVGHVTAWGGDPLELLDLADHVQLRQAKPGHTQVVDGSGVVDLAAVLGRLADLDYRGRLSVEFFDLPDMGWPLADPRAAALDIAAQVRALLR